MRAEISKEVVIKVEEAQRTNSEVRIPVIITLEPSYGSDFSSLKIEGLVIDGHSKTINAISGTIPSTRVTELAKHPGITRIEYDGRLKL